MKKFLNILGIVASVFAVILLFILEMALGINLATRDFFSAKTMSESVQKMDFQVILVDENNNETETGIKFYRSFEQMGLKKEQVNAILKNNEFKEIFGNYLGTIMLKKFDEKTEINYPTKSELVNFVKENYELLENVLDLKENDQSKIEELIDKNYVEIKKELEKLAEEIGEL